MSTNAQTPTVPSIPTEKGSVPVTEADDVLLAKFNSWYEALPQDDKRRAKYDAVAFAVRAELTERTKPEAEPAASEALATTDHDAEQAALEIARVSRPDAITERLAELQKNFHLVTPATHIDILPEGFGVSVSMVHVNAADCYNVGGKLGLGKVTLEQIWAAAGGTWDPVLTRRLDNGRDPRYCHYRAVGTVRNFDGTPRQVSGEVEIDARDGSDLINEITTKAKERESGSNYKGKRDGGASQILELRKFLLRHAESKAKNRAIAGMGVKRAYLQAELKKPFAVARLTFTGRTEDPELRRDFARMNAQAALGGSLALYGGSQAPRQLSAGAEGHEAPPVGGGFVDEELPFDAEDEPDTDPTNGDGNRDPAQGGPL